VRKNPNKAVYKPEENAVIILMASGKAIIDAEDYVRVKDYCWMVYSGFAAMRRPGNRSPVYLHRVIMNAESGDRVLFASSDNLDCRKANLVHIPKKDVSKPKVKTETNGFRYNSAARKRPFLDQVDPRTGEVVVYGSGPRGFVREANDEELAYDCAEKAKHNGEEEDGEE